jgi:hypothetical protein
MKDYNKQKVKFGGIIWRRRTQTRDKVVSIVEINPDTSQCAYEIEIPSVISLDVEAIHENWWDEDCKGKW